MARIVQNGAELNTTTAGFEYTSTTGPGLVSVTSTDTRNSRYAWEFEVGFSDTGGKMLQSNITTSDGTTSYYTKFDFRIAGVSSDINNPQIFVVKDAAGTQTMAIRLLESFALSLENRNNTQVVSGPTLSVGPWYTIEFSFIYAASPTFSSAELKVDGVSYGSGTVGGTLGVSANNYTSYSWGMSESPANLPNPNIFQFDNIIINSAAGVFENSWVGEQYLIYLHPNATMTEPPTTGGGVGSLYWQTQAGGSGSGTTANWQSVDDVPPDDDTSYLRKNTNNEFRDWYVIETITDADNIIQPTDIITTITVGARMGGNGGTSRTAAYLYETASGGVGLQRSGSFDNNANAWFMYSVADVPSQPIWMSYPSDVLGINLNTYQIGIEALQADSRQIRDSSIWMEVTFTQFNSDFFLHFDEMNIG